MTLVEKFQSDILKTIKHERADNNGRYNAKSACEKICKLFERNCSVPSSIARAIAFYWMDEYIDRSITPENEPTEEHIEKICAFLSFLNDCDEGEEVLNENDLNELNDAINDEAETMPIEVLQSLMGKLVERGIL